MNLTIPEAIACNCPAIPTVLYYIFPIAFLLFLTSSFGVWAFITGFEDWKDLAVLLTLAINGGSWLCLILALLLFG